MRSRRKNTAIAVFVATLDQCLKTEKRGMPSQGKHELFRINNQLCRFSADGKYLASAFQSNLLVKSTKTLTTVYSYLFPTTIEYIEWSPDSQYILCASIKNASIQIYSINHPLWKCKIIEGSAGLESATWSPNSRHIITTADFKIQISIWSLENKTALYIKQLKSSANEKLQFSPDGKKLAVIGTDDGQDYVEIYKTDTWRISRKLICDGLNSIDDICWSPNSEILCIWCCVSGEPKLMIYSNVTEKTIAIYQPIKPQRKIGPSNACSKDLIGIDIIKWNPNGQLLAVAGYNEMLVLLNNVTWNPLLELRLDPVIIDSDYTNKVYKEHIFKEKESDKSGKHILEAEYDRPLNIQIGKTDVLSKCTVAKTDVLEFSACGRYIAIKHQVYPTTLWIWDIITDSIEYLLLQNEVVAAKWNPVQEQLLVLTESIYFFVWTPEIAKCVSTPQGITVLNAQWHPAGDQILFCGYNKAVLSHVKDLL